MKLFLYLFVLTFLNIPDLQAQSYAELNVSKVGDDYLFVIKHDFRLRYGVKFPLTFSFSIPEDKNNFFAAKRHSLSEDWFKLPEKHYGEIYNDIEAARFDYEKNIAFVSASFGDSDSLFINISDGAGNSVRCIYEGITKYYDNRESAVTASADDWFDEYNYMFPPLLELFRSRGLYVSAGIVTSYTSNSSWKTIQDEFDKGFLEVASHSRTHPFVPYKDYHGEVIGSVSDIVANLNLSGYYSGFRKEYVYVWIAPSGNYDSTINKLIGTESYLAPRLYIDLPKDTPRVYIYGETAFSKWNDEINHFEAFLPTVEIGAPDWGGGNNNLSSLNNLFDSIRVEGGVYHLMWHPQTIYDDQEKPYLVEHLNYISRHPDIWYAALGPLYLYHLVQSANIHGTTGLNEMEIINTHGSLKLEQNYPNPCNPSTTINFELPENRFVNITLYNMLGEKVATLANENMEKGIYNINLSTDGLTSGIYVYRLTSGEDVFAKKMTLLK